MFDVIRLFYISSPSRPINTLCTMADRERFSTFGVGHLETGSVAVSLLTTPLTGRSWIQLPWCHCNFSLIYMYSFRPHSDPGVNSASKRNEYHLYFLGVDGNALRSYFLLYSPLFTLN